MRRLSFVVGALALGAVAGLVVACDEPVSLLPTTPSGFGLAAIEISGPSSVAPGQSAQFTATIRLSDGTRKTASPGTNVQWRTSNSLLQINASGIATAGQTRGDSGVTATVGGGNTTRFASKEVVVVPEGTYRMVGFVTDAEAHGLPVIGARVEVNPGSLVGMTDLAGQYRLYGVPASAEIQVTKSGYMPVTRSVQLTAHSTQNFELSFIGMRLNLAGSYTLVLDIPGNCSGGSLSADLRHRVYDAVLTQNGPAAEVLLTEPRFRLNSIGRGNKFSGQIDATGAIFTLDPFDDYYYYYSGPTYYPNVAERLQNGSFLVPNGMTVTTVSNGVVSGLMNGAIYNWDSRFPFGSLLAYCNSSAIQFTLTPR